VIVSDTSPITNLAAIGQLELLRTLYQTLRIPDGVRTELEASAVTWPGQADVIAATWLERRSITNYLLVTALQRDLDLGEAESIVLALELKAELILMDEKEGRHAAQRLGLRPLGVIGILIEAKGKNIITEIRPHLDALRQQAGFYISQKLYNYVLVQTNETSKESYE